MEKIKELFRSIIAVDNDYKSLIPRIIVGLVFLSEGIQKYIMPEVVGSGRFEGIGFEHFEFLAYFVGTFEIICGILLLAGFMVRLSSIPLLIIMFTAIVSTKIPILMEQGFWVMAHTSRTDFAMTMMLIYLVIYGAGKYSLDSIMMKIGALFLLLLIPVIMAGCSEDDIVVDQPRKLQINLQQMIDSVYNAYHQKVPDFPGGIAMKVLNRKESYFVSAGMDSSVSARSRFRAASCTKTFTATAVLLLHQQGKLNINHYLTNSIPGTSDPYLPDTPEYDIPNKCKITILDLMRHRAGVFDLTNDIIPDTIPGQVPYKGLNYIEYKISDNPSYTFNFDELIQVVSEIGVSYFTPGTAYRYSNTGYTILGKIIENVSGKSFQDYLMNNVMLLCYILFSRTHISHSENSLSFITLGTFDCPPFFFFVSTQS